jgi:hypothetical protein
MCPSSNDRACPSPEKELLFPSGEKAEIILRTSPPLAFFSGTGDSSGMIEMKVTDLFNNGWCDDDAVSLFFCTFLFFQK